MLSLALIGVIALLYAIYSIVNYKMEMKLKNIEYTIEGKNLEACDAESKHRKESLEREIEQYDLERRVIENDFESKLKKLMIGVFTTILIMCIAMFLAFIIYIITFTKIDSLNSTLNNMEIVSYEDAENNIIVKGKYVVRLEKRKVHYDLSISLKNLNRKELSFARVIENNTDEKCDFTNIGSGDEKSNILLKDVTEDNKYDVITKNIVFEE